MGAPVPPERYLSTSVTGLRNADGRCLTIYLLSRNAGGRCLTIYFPSSREQAPYFCIGDNAEDTLVLRGGLQLTTTARGLGGFLRPRLPPPSLLLEPFPVPCLCAPRAGVPRAGHLYCLTSVLTLELGT